MAKTQQRTIPGIEVPERLAELIDLVNQGRAFDPPSMRLAQDIAIKTEKAIIDIAIQDETSIPPVSTTKTNSELKIELLETLNDVYQEITGLPFQDPDNIFNIPAPTRSVNPVSYPITQALPFDPLNGGYQDTGPIPGGLTNFMEHQLDVLPQLLGTVVQGAQFSQALNPQISDPCAIVDQILGAITGFINDLLSSLLQAIQPILDAIAAGIGAVLAAIDAVLGLINDILNQIAQFILDQIAALVDLLAQLLNILPIQSLIAFLSHPCVNFIFQTATNGGISTQSMANTLSDITPGAIF